MMINLQMKKELVFSVCALVIGILQIVVILVSWLITAAMPDVFMRSLLSNEGVRWFFGHFTENLATPFLVWLLLLSIAYGSLRYSGLLQAIMNPKSLDYPKHFALNLVIFELVSFTIVLILLTVIPHAILLSVTGCLFPSSFSNSIIPIICFCICFCSVSYGKMCGSLNSLQSIFHSLTIGVTYSKQLWLLYVLGAELYSSIRFVFEL